MRLSVLAEQLGCRLEGDGTIEVSRVAGIEEAEPGDLTFYVNPRYTAQLHTTRASAVILGDAAPAAPCAMLRCAEPYLTFAYAVSLFAPAAPAPAGINTTCAVAPDAHVHPSASIGPFVSIGARAVIGARSVLHSHVCIGPGAVVGDDCVLHAHVCVRERVVIGHRVILQNGAVIGSDGFGFAQRGDGSHQKIPQVGLVVIEDDVEIGANAAIDRPALGETRIGAGTKIDNLVQIAHGVTVGRNALLAAQVGIAGSATIEDNVVLAGQVGVAGHLTVGRAAKATAQSGIPSSVEPGALVSGYPAIDNREWLKASAVFRKLPELRRALADLAARLERLEHKLLNPDVTTDARESRKP